MDIKNAALIGLGAMGVFFAPRMEEHLGRENFCANIDASIARAQEIELG